MALRRLVTIVSDFLQRLGVLARRTGSGARPVEPGSSAGATERASRRVRFVSCETEWLPGSQCRVRVRLAPASGDVVEGTAESDGGDLDRARSAAQATVAALRQALKLPDDALRLQQIEAVEVFKSPVVAVALAARHNGAQRALLGFCRVGADPAQAAPFAVLGAANRFFGIG